MNRKLDLLWLRIREYFKHPAEDIRQALPVVPGRIYKNFGYVCKAVPMTRRELDYVGDKSSFGLPRELVADMRPADDAVRQLYQLGQMPGMPVSDIPSRCNLCDFYRKAIPCPLHNVLADGSAVCDTHKYVILKDQ